MTNYHFDMETTEKSRRVNMFREVIEKALKNYTSHTFNKNKICDKCGYDLSGATDDYNKPVKSCDEIYYIKDILE